MTPRDTTSLQLQTVAEFTSMQLMSYFRSFIQQFLRNPGIPASSLIVVAIHLPIILLITSGCANWYPGLSNHPSKPASANSIELPADHLSVQTIFIRLDEAESRALEVLWPDLEEISIDYDQRQHLDQNGIRCGIIMGEVPTEIQKWLDRTEMQLRDDPLEQLGANADVQSHSTVMLFRSGAEKDVIVKPMRTGELVVMHHASGGGGNTYIDPAMMFKMRGKLTSDGTIDLSLTPAIEHGQYKNKIIGEDFAMRREITRDLQTWPTLAIQRQLLDGQYLVLSGTKPPRAIGQHFFTTKLKDGTEARLVLLIRVTRSRSDSAFTSTTGANKP